MSLENMSLPIDIILQILFYCQGNLAKTGPTLALIEQTCKAFMDLVQAYHYPWKLAVQRLRLQTNV